MTIQTSKTEKIFSMLKLACLDTFTNVKLKYPIISDIANSGSNREMDNIINIIHKSIGDISYDIIVKLKKINLIN
jgi:hypothetical protein